VRRQGRPGKATTVVVAALSAAFAFGPPPPSAAGASPSPTPTAAHIFVIMMENHGYTDLVGNASAPWINATIAASGVATSSYAVAHPSQPNYIAATAGSTYGVSGDGDVTLDVPNIADQVEASGRTWKAYMQSLASCDGDVLRSFCGGQLYARKHDPFVSFQDIQADPARLARIVDLTQLDSDLAAGTVPALAWISPDQCHDMHGLEGYADPSCAVADDAQRIATGDAFLAATVSAITSSSAWTSGSSIFITWDEAGSRDSTGCCDADPGGGHILTIVIDHDQPGPRSSAVAYNHYSLLATLESVLGLGCLGNVCDTGAVQPMTDLLEAPAPPS
jgi:hypothetical protein